ncbi:MAG: SRPBCC domain-containing protein [Pyrinomonadaceae bacterium]
MDCRKHVHAEDFPVSPEKMFEILCRPSAICGWWGASQAIVLPKNDGVWTAAWGEDPDDPDYISSFRIKEYEPPRRILFTDAEYFSKDGGLPFEADLTAEFIVEPSDSGCTLKVIQDGFPADPVADDFYSACETGWKNTFEGIRKYLSGR